MDADALQVLVRGVEKLGEESAKDRRSTTDPDAKARAKEELLLLSGVLLSRASIDSPSAREDEDYRALITLLSFPRTMYQASKYIVQVICSVDVELEEFCHAEEIRVHAPKSPGPDSLRMQDRQSSPGVFASPKSPAMPPELQLQSVPSPLLGPREAKSPQSGALRQTRSPIAKHGSAQMSRQALDQLLRKQVLMDSLINVLTKTTTTETKSVILEAIRSIASSDVMRSNPRLAYRIGLRDRVLIRAVSAALASPEGEDTERDSDFHNLAMSTLRTLDALLRQPYLRRGQYSSEDINAALSSVTRALGSRPSVLSEEIFRAFLSFAGDGESHSITTMYSPQLWDTGMQRISNALVIAATFRIARAAGASLRHSFLASINSLCQYGSHNRYVFAKAGAVDVILAWLVECEDPEELSMLSQILGHIMEFSSQPEQMTRMFNLIQSRTSGGHPGHALVLLETLERSLRRNREPAAMFDLSGRRSGLVSTSCLPHFPPARACYTLSIWFRAENLEVVQSLVSLVDDHHSSLDVSASSHSLVVKSNSGAKESSTHDSTVRVDECLEVGEWTHIVIAHGSWTMFSRLSELGVFVNGQQVAVNQVKHPKFSSGGVTLELGVSSSAKRSTSFRGQIGALQIFGETLKKDEVAAIYSLGPGNESELLSYDPNFSFRIAPEQATLRSQRLSEKLVFLLSPRASDEKTCPDNAPPTASGTRHSSVAKFLGTEGASKVLVKRGSRFALDAIGGLWPLVCVFSSLKELTTKLGKTNVISSRTPLELGISVLISYLRDNPRNQAAAIRSDLLPITTVLAQDCPSNHLTLGLVKELLQGLQLLKSNSSVVTELGRSWLCNFHLWSRADDSVQVFLLEELLVILRTLQERNLLAIWIGTVIDVGALTDAASSTESAKVRTVLISVSIWSIFAKNLANQNTSSQEARTLFHLLDGVHEPKERRAAVALMEILVEMSVEDQNVLIDVLGTFVSGTLRAAITAIDCDEPRIRELAISVACILARRQKGASAVRAVVVGLQQFLTTDRIDIRMHQLLLNVSFGDTSGGKVLSAIPEVIPVAFYKFQEDGDFPSRLTALRSLTNELENNPRNLSLLLRCRLWPLWMSEMLLEAELVDEELTHAFTTTLGEICGQVGQHIMTTMPIGKFCNVLDNILACKNYLFKCVAMESFLGLISNALAQYASKDFKSDSSSHRIDLTERLNAVTLCVELLVEEDEAACERSQSLISRTLDALMLAQVWRLPTIPRRDTSLVPRTLPSSGTISRLLSPATSEAQPVEGHYLRQTSTNLVGGFLRSTLRIVCWSIVHDRDPERRENRKRVLTSLLAPVGHAALPEAYMHYLKLWLEHTRKLAGQDAERAEICKSLWEESSDRWKKHPKHAKKSSSDVSPEEKATDMMTEEDIWIKIALAHLERLSAILHGENEDTLQSLKDEGTTADQSRKDEMDRRSIFNEMRKETASATFQARTKTLQHTWQMLQEQNHLDFLQLENVAPSPPIFTSAVDKVVLDRYQDCAGRRWLLRLDPNGTDHGSARLASAERGDAAQMRTEMVLPLHQSSSQQELDGLVPVEIVRQPQDHDEDDETRDAGDLSTPLEEQSSIQTPDGRTELDDSTEDQDETGVDDITPSTPESKSRESTVLSDTASLAAESAISGTILRSSPCTLIQPLIEISGTLDVTAAGITFRPSPYEESETGGRSSDMIFERRIRFREIREVHSRRYLLRPLAFEVFVSSREAFLFALPNAAGCKSMLKTVDDHLKKIGKAKVIRTSKARNQAVKDAQTKWKRGQLSNFDYLMILNKLAGRTYNDIAQYPVFPWVLADYSSQVLDLANSKSYRDLSKPMGCQRGEDDPGDTEVGKREQYFRSRYESWEDPRGLPKFHYGSHYSSAGVVLHFLLRMEPFTTLFLKVQGGYFDVADRLFLSVAGAWKEATTSLQSVNEIVPEMYYMPMMFRNSNGLPLGTTQEGRAVNDVELPPWANGSPETFVRLHAEALESEYVSANLPDWIDLIFGMKQRGRAAVDACNVFYYLTYEGAVDMEKLPVDLSQAIVEQIAYFGQTPIQLMKKAHPQREARQNPSLVNLADHQLAAVFDSMESASGHDPIIWIVATPESLFAVGRSRNFAVHKFLPLPDLYGNPFTFEADVRVVSGEATSQGKRSRGRRVGGAHFAPGFSEIALGGLFRESRDGRVIFSAGHWDCSVRCTLTSSPGRARQILRGHQDVVTCLDVAEGESLLVTGSRDCIVLVWRINQFIDYDREKSRGIEIVHAIPSLILHGHVTAVICVSVNAEVGCVASCDESGRMLLHSVRDGRMLQIIDLNCTGGIERFALTNAARILAFSRNGREIVSATVHNVIAAKTTAEVDVTSFCVSRDSSLLITGDSQGEVTVYSVWDLTLLKRHRACPGTAITSVALDAQSESVALVGRRDGKILAVTLDPASLRTQAIKNLQLSKTTTPAREGL
mmetsp:Transcript_14616/g.59322  ORF Transcript_14616/g.59322 Transcript_14616/m.59322 type:complete len:2453 (-) Transcript_14616:815-8173(-)